MGNKEIYLLQQGDTDLYKIGISKNTKKRIKQLQTGCSQPIKLVNVYESIFYSRIESTLHRRFKLQNTLGEWFRLTTEDVNSFPAACKKLETTFKFLEENKI